MLLTTLQFDEDNEEKLARRQISPFDAYDVLHGKPKFFRNKRRRSGIYKMIGPDRGGRMLSIVIRPTGVAGVWQPVTGWLSTRAEIRAYKR